MQAQRVRRHGRVPLHGRRARHDRTRAILEELAVEDPRIRVLDNPQRTTAYALNVGLAAARGRYVARMDAHAFYPRTYLASGVERLSRGDVAWVAGAAVPRGEGRWSRRVELALNSGLTTIGSRKWQAAPRAGRPGGGRARHRRVRGRVAALDARGARRLGPGVARSTRTRSSPRACSPTGGRIVMLPAMAAEYVPRNSAEGARAAVLPLRPLPRQDEPPPRRTRCGARTCSPRGSWPPPLAAVAAPRLGARCAPRRRSCAYAAALAATAVRVAEPGRERDAAALPLVFAIMHLTLGRRLPRELRALRPAACGAGAGSWRGLLEDEERAARVLAQAREALRAGDRRRPTRAARASAERRFGSTRLSGISGIVRSSRSWCSKAGKISAHSAQSSVVIGCSSGVRALGVSAPAEAQDRVVRRAARGTPRGRQAAGSA